MSFTVKDSVWLVGVILALGVTWGMTSQRVNALEKDMDRMENALITFTKIESRIAVIEVEIKNINKKLDTMKGK
jgi:uncharacterized protein YpuA (DUF1002 family)|tara:strand:+ start:512 stop:733 length:222 start_codon:yes stop_codon:yes gene_type:complete